MKSDADKIDETLGYELGSIWEELESIKYSLREIKQLYKQELLHKGVIKDDKQSNTSR
jgi:hypothetical protein